MAASSLLKRRLLNDVLSRCIIVSKRYNHVELLHNNHINRLSRDRLNEWLERPRITSTPIKIIDTESNADIINIIDETFCSKTILKIIKTNIENIQHVQVFGKSILKCDSLKDWQSVHEIMKLALKSNIKLNDIIFNHFINSMARSDSPELCIKYFYLMIKEYKLTPNEITFAALLKSLKYQIKYKEAEKIWNIMMNQYDIKPDGILFVEMISIYGKSHQIEKAMDIFNQYLQCLENGELKPHRFVFNAYLNVFSRIGHINRMQNVTNLMKQYDINLDKFSVSDIMRGCLNAGKPKKCIKTLEKWMDLGEKPEPPMIAMKAAALNNMIKANKNSFKQRYKLYLELKDTINRQSINITQRIAATQLLGAIYLYYDNNPIQIVNVFESLLDKNLIGYKAYNIYDDKMEISLRMFLPIQAQFILRYLFGFKIKELMEELLGNDDTLKIIVGKGKRTSKGNEKGIIRQFVINELLSWNPPINVQVNNGFVTIHKKQLIPYFENNMNDAKIKLINPSKDWYLD